jgi:hypothetical protein
MGYLDGAIQSGRRAAGEVMRAEGAVRSGAAQATARARFFVHRPSNTL